MSNIIRKFVWNITGRISRLFNCVSFPLKHDSKQIVVFNTSMDTDNLGDFIIMRYCGNILNELYEDYEFVDVSTHKMPSAEDEKIVKQTKYKFVCGTNLLTSHIEKWWNWRLPDGLRKKFAYRNAILLGAGWGNYQDECSEYSRMIYKCILNPNVIHSVRDQYTEEKLKQAGIKNVINTGCPTMWRLTPEFCRSIPMQKAKNVVTTITDYRPDECRDNFMLEILSRNYENVYLWIQGSKDEEYLSKLNLPNNLIIIPESLEAYEEQLKRGQIDYVGTRLHAGIFALNHHIRSIIIAVDNRAIEIAKDTNLPIVSREQVQEILEDRIVSDFSTEINLNQNNIDLFKAQFKRL